MAHLRGDSTVGGKPIVTLDVMNTFVEQIQGVGLKAKINKFEEDVIADFNTANTIIKNTDKVGFWQVNNAANNDNKYSYGQLSNLSNKNARFQLYAPHHESGYSALYFRTGWNNDLKSWERVTTQTMLTTELNKKFDKTGGTITGSVAIENGLTCEGLISQGTVNWLKYGTAIGANRDCGITSSNNGGLELYTSAANLTIENNAFKYNNNNVWHTGNLNPDNYVSRTATLLSNSTDLNTVTTTGYYRCSTPVNAPSKITGWAYIEVIKHDNSYALQKIYSYDGNHTYSRTLNNGTWTAWRPLGGGLSYTQNITAGNWSLNDGVYELTVTHNIGSTNLTSVIVTDSNNMSMFTGFQIISSTVVKVFSSTNPAGKIVINAIQ